MKRIIALGMLMVLVLAAGASGDVPQTISYQGVLKDDTGAIVSDGDYDFTFRIYDVATNGTALWTEDQTKHVTAGILNVVLGEVTPITLPFDEQYWLGVTIGTGDELSPRTLLTGVPYALNARAVLGTHNEFPDSGRVGIGTIDPERMLHVVSNDLFVMEVEGTRPASWATLSIDASAGGTPCLEFRSNDLYMAKQYITSAGNWYLDIGPDCVMYAKGNSKNVGIGTTDPAERLDVDGAVRLGTTDSTNAGTIRWTGADFEGYDGGTWLSLTAGGSGSLPPGSLGQTIRHNGSDWVASSFLYNDGDRIGIGTASPTAELEVIGDNMTNHFKLTAPTGAGPSLYFNAVNKDWTIYGSNPGSSAGDRKLVFRDFSAATDRMVIDENGRVGIGEMNPEAKLHVAGGYWNLDEEGGDLKIGDDTYQLRFGIMTTTAWAGNAGIRVDGGQERLTFSCGSEETMTLHSGGFVQIGDYDLHGGFSVYPHGAWGSSDSLGGTLGIAHHSSGYASGYMSSAYDNEFTSVMRLARGLDESDMPEWGLEYIGSYAGSEEPHLYISGSSRAALFKMSSSDDSSVELPVNSIADHEILDEPGAASAIEGLMWVELNGSIQSVISRSITVPTSGYIQAIATAQVWISHIQGIASEANFGVSNATGGFPVNQDVMLRLADGIPSGTYDFPVTVHGLFEVASGGTFTYHLLGHEASGNIDVYDMQLTLLFIPTAYGTVSPTLAMDASVFDDAASKRSPLTSAEIASERSESETLNRDRIERELARMREEIRALKQAVARESYVRVEKER